MSDAGPGNVLFIDGTDCEGSMKSRMGGRVNARVRGVSSSKIRPIDDANDIIVQCVQGQESLVRSLIRFNFAGINFLIPLISALGGKSSKDWVGTCTSACFSNFHIDDEL